MNHMTRKIQAHEIARRLVQLGEFYSLTGPEAANLEAKAVAYAEDLSGIALEVIDSALVYVRRSSKRYPSLADIWAAVNRVQADRQQDAVLLDEQGNPTPEPTPWPEYCTQTGRHAYSRARLLGCVMDNVTHEAWQREGPRLVTLDDEALADAVEMLDRDCAEDAAERERYGGDVHAIIQAAGRRMRDRHGRL